MEYDVTTYFNPSLNVINKIDELSHISTGLSNPNMVIYQSGFSKFWLWFSDGYIRPKQLRG